MMQYAFQPRVKGCDKGCDKVLLPNLQQMNLEGLIRHHFKVRREISFFIVLFIRFSIFFLTTDLKKHPRFKSSRKITYFCHIWSQNQFVKAFKLSINMYFRNRFAFAKKRLFSWFILCVDNYNLFTFPNARSIRKLLPFGVGVLQRKSSLEFLALLFYYEF